MKKQFKANLTIAIHECLTGQVINSILLLPNLHLIQSLRRRLLLQRLGLSLMHTIPLVLHGHYHRRHHHPMAFTKTTSFLLLLFFGSFYCLNPPIVVKSTAKTIKYPPPLIPPSPDKIWAPIQTLFYLNFFFFFLSHQKIIYINLLFSHLFLSFFPSFESALHPTLPQIHLLLL